MHAHNRTLRSMLLFGSIAELPHNSFNMDFTCDQTLKSCAKDLPSRTMAA